MRFDLAGKIAQAKREHGADNADSWVKGVERDTGRSVDDLAAEWDAKAARRDVAVERFRQRVLNGTA